MCDGNEIRKIEQGIFLIHHKSGMWWLIECFVTFTCWQSSIYMTPRNEKLSFSFFLAKHDKEQLVKLVNRTEYSKINWKRKKSEHMLQHMEFREALVFVLFSNYSWSSAWQDTIDQIILCPAWKHFRLQTSIAEYTFDRIES